jgi:small subunit ribosomal protein S6e
MVFKVNIGTKEGKTYKFETSSEELMGKTLGEKIDGELISSELKGYEVEITGLSDGSGFTAIKEVEGIGKKRVLLKYGKAMHKRSRREGKKKRSNFTPGGLRLRKTVRGNAISPEIVQINTKIIKEGSKKLSEISLPSEEKKE